jgi:hypothetical protein
MDTGWPGARAGSRSGDACASRITLSRLEYPAWRVLARQGRHKTANFLRTGVCPSFLRPTENLTVQNACVTSSASIFISPSMKSLKAVLLGALLIALVNGCRAPGHVKAGEPERICVGMSKEEVIKHLGRPEYVAADGKSETLNYVLERPWWQDKPFRVKLVGGKVESYEVIER